MLALSGDVRTAKLNNSTAVYVTNKGDTLFFSPPSNSIIELLTSRALPKDELIQSLANIAPALSTDEIEELLYEAIASGVIVETYNNI